MDSSRRGRHKIVVHLRAGAHPEVTAGAAPHEELANVRSEYKAAWNFENRWGPLLPPDTVRDGNVVVWSPNIVRDGTLEASTTPPAPNLAEEFGEQNAEKLFTAVGGGLVVSIRDILRDAWQGSEYALVSIHNQVARYGLSTWEFKSGHIEIVPDSLWTTICILFLRDHAAGRTGYCANPGCASPYFLKKRRTQKYCEAGPCVQYAQRQYALRWWNKDGKKRRARKRDKRNRKPGRKTQ